MKVLRLHFSFEVSSPNMASLRKRVSKWMLRSSEDSDATTARSSEKHSRMDLERGSLDSGYHSLRALENQDSIPLGDEYAPKSTPRRLHKAWSTTFTYLSETVRSGAAYIYNESTKEEEAPAVEWSEMESQTPRKRLRRRSSLFSSMRRRKNLPIAPAPDARAESSTPTRRMLTDEAPTLDDVMIPK